MKKRINKRSFRTGLSMIETIITIVVLAGLVGYVYSEVMNSKTQTDIKSTADRDIKTIFKAVGDWKITSANSDSTFKNINTSEIVSRLPNYLEYDSTDDVIKSSSWKGGCAYQVASDTINNDGDSFSIDVDCEEASKQNAWSTRFKTLVETNMIDTAHSLTMDKDNDSSTNSTVGDAKVVLGKLVI